MKAEFFVAARTSLADGVHRSRSDRPASARTPALLCWQHRQRYGFPARPPACSPRAFSATLHAVFSAPFHFPAALARAVDVFVEFPTTEICATYLSDQPLNMRPIHCVYVQFPWSHLTQTYFVGRLCHRTRQPDVRESGFHLRASAWPSALLSWQCPQR